MRDIADVAVGSEEVEPEAGRDHDEASGDLVTEPFIANPPQI